MWRVAESGLCTDFSSVFRRHELPDPLASGQPPWCRRLFFSNDINGLEKSMAPLQGACPMD